MSNKVMKYTRTKYGIIKIEWGCQFRLGKKGYYEVEEKEDCFGNSKYVVKRYIKNAIESADTIEELIMPQDLLFLIDKNGNRIPFYVENVDYLNAWLRTHDIYKINELYIKNGKDYIFTAKMNDKGEWELL